MSFWTSFSSADRSVDSVWSWNHNRDQKRWPWVQLKPTTTQRTMHPRINWGLWKSEARRIFFLNPDKFSCSFETKAESGLKSSSHSFIVFKMGFSLLCSQKEKSNKNTKQLKLSWACQTNRWRYDLHSKALTANKKPERSCDQEAAATRGWQVFVFKPATLATGNMLRKKNTGHAAKVMTSSYISTTKSKTNCSFVTYKQVKSAVTSVSTSTKLPH